MNKKTRIILIASIAVLILGMAFFPKIKSAFSPEKQNGIPVQGGPGAGGAGGSELMVSATVLLPQTLNNMFRITGILLPDEEVDLTFETAGKITNIYFKEGSY